MRRRLFLFATALSGLGLSGPAHAQPVAPADSLLPEVSVVATRAAVAALDAPARVEVRTRADVEATGARSAADLLSARGTALVQRYGPGGLASLALRGSTAAQTLVLLDGHRLTDPQLGQLDLALLPALLLDRVEVLHGAGSALHGGGAIGGALALTTPRAYGEGPRVEAESRAGAWGERSVGGLAAAPFGPLAVAVAAEHRTARADFPYFDPNAGVSGGTVRRTGADESLFSIYARAETEGATRAALSLWAGRAERGIPGAAGTAAEQGGRQWDRHLRLWGDVTTPAGPGATLRVGGLLQRASLRYSGPATDDTGRTTLAEGTAEWQRARGSFLLALGVEGGWATAQHPSLTDGASEKRGALWGSAVVQRGRFLVYPAVRLDAFTRQDGPMLAAVSPRLGLNVRLAPALHLKAAAGTAFRPPTFNDRFWRYADPTAPAGDPALRPERAWTLDTGARLERGGLAAEATVYLAGARDQIVWLPGPTGLYAPENIARTRTRGLEATLDVAPRRAGPVRVGGGAAYALTDARDRTSPDVSPPLRYVARHLVRAWTGVGATVGPVALTLDLHARLVGPRPTRADGGAPLPAHLVLDGGLRAARRFPRLRAEAGLGVENLTDTAYSVVGGYPMPPRHARFSLRLSFLP